MWKKNFEKGSLEMFVLLCDFATESEKVELIENAPTPYDFRTEILISFPSCLTLLSRLNEQVPRMHLVDYGSIRYQSCPLVSSVLGLRFHVQQHHLRQGELRLRCESTLAREILRRGKK
ncbi:uncharacterized protein CEXT_576281 [Caerostris extrusa]|uniref:Uncharacterized protein n=1 Tax=Caerostris extrusa TaxID=172846 RepID=A0AAV4QK58_CAEEX|nr:uncharacterized protein CEXT_576281 [Caerostris extrusa]